ncbi:MAG: iron-sulfur cluster assembly accessory protein [Verrucomicrobiales bacterium]|nr:iron-sulfur cluster assembly accessory protein [Verrucomicrobiales bacterium]
MVTVTPNAAEEIQNLREKETDRNGEHLRVYIEKGGCSGMQYGMVFDEERPDDFKAQWHGVTILVDPFSADYVRGSIVDFSDELTGGGFKINNPNAKDNCGCGKSFSA